MHKFKLFSTLWFKVAELFGKSFYRLINTFRPPKLWNNLKTRKKFKYLLFESV